MIGPGKAGTYTRLLVSLMLVVILEPFFDLLPWGGLILNVAFVGVIVSAAWDISKTPRVVAISFLLGIPAIATQIAAIVAGSEIHIIGTYVEGMVFVFFAFAIFEIIRDLATRSDVSNDTIRGAICAYLLLGLAWAAAYNLVVYFQPGAIDFGPANTVESKQNLTYYSFVVLTTLGFGDISPVSGLAKSLTWIEAVTGQIFIATIIARLVGLGMFNKTDQ
jgi:hypothetical protein